MISSRKDFDSLFDNFQKMRAISYVVSSDLLSEFIEKRGYAEIEVLVGEDITEPALRQELEGKGDEIIEQLAELVKNGRLRIFVPTKTIHSKVYILEGSGLTRVIISSANLTMTARDASKQTNYAWSADVPPDDPLLRQVVSDYKAHLKGCTRFMEDLKELFDQHKDVPKKELIGIWLQGGGLDEEEAPETTIALQQIAINALESVGQRQEPYIRVQLPDNPTVRRQVERFLAPIKPVKTQDETSLNSLDLIHYVEEHYRLPIMRVDLERGQIWLGIAGSVIPLTESLPDPVVVSKALQHIEDYLNTVDLGQSLDPKLAKACMLEALLYVFFAPFANEHMKVRRSKLGTFQRRGPRFLYIYGDTQNGKSTFLHFALKFLTGYAIEPLAASDFTKRRVSTAGAIATAFPLMFDDLNPSQRSAVFEEVLKSYWEVWWKEGLVSPQIIMTSNMPSLKDWAKSRVKRVDFDVHFTESEQSKEKLNTIYSSPNPIFKWFSYLYIQHLKSDAQLTDDELGLARTVVKELYEHARRPLPDFFPQKPIELLYDPGVRVWRDLIYQLKKVRIIEEKERILAEFSKDVPVYEIKGYQSELPQGVKQKRRGNTVIIESPSQFKTWLEGQGRRRRSLFDRLKPSFLKGRSPTSTLK